MKKVISLLFCFLLVGCSCNKENKKIEYTHYLRGGGNEKLEASILWEYSNEAYTKYQVAYTSYVCSDPSVNYINVIYLELTNKGSKEDSLIRNISFSTLEENGVTFNVGLWGDYQKTGSYEIYSSIENNLLPNLKYSKYETIDSIAIEGYDGYTSIEGIDADSVTGATVSASNVISIVKAIFEYHLNKYY